MCHGMLQRPFPHPDLFIHGSSDKTFEDGVVLSARPGAYLESWSSAPFYDLLHYWKPNGLLSHHESVFMVGTDEDLDVAGGALDAVYHVEPLGHVQRHDMNWSSLISCLRDETSDPEDPRVRSAAEAYWAGVPSHDDVVWEYLSPELRIVQKLEEEPSFSP